MWGFILSTFLELFYRWLGASFNWYMTQLWICLADIFSSRHHLSIPDNGKQRTSRVISLVSSHLLHKESFFRRITTKHMFKGSFYTSEGSLRGSFICDFLINTNWLWAVNNLGVSPRNQKVKTSHEKKPVPMMMSLKTFLFTTLYYDTQVRR